MEADPFVGVVIQGRYVIEREIGRGAMGRLYEARSRSGSVIAVKLLHPHLLTEPEILERFKRESTTAHRLSPSPYIARVLSSGSLDEGYPYYPYICFERLDGESLFERLRHTHRLDLAAVLRVVDHVLQGLAVAHPTLVHRDIKPANIFLVPEPDGTERSVILDFGISKIRDGRALTKVQSTLGSVAYMAPEQMDDAAGVDARADLYAVGVVAFECLTGRLPFAGRDTIELQQFKRLRRARSLESQMGESWSPRLASLESVVSRLLARSPSERHPSAADALAAWRSAAAELGDL